jgi:hypothetical protein
MHNGVHGKRFLSGAVAVAALALGALAPNALGAGSSVDQLGSALKPLRSADPSEIRNARATDIAIAGGAVAVDVYVSGDPEAAAKQLEALGMDVAATATDPVPLVEGALPLDSLAGAAKLGSTVSVLPVQGGGVDVGAATSQGVAAHNIPAAITAAGTNGTGIDVGVISDSINKVGLGVAGSQATGDLPANTIVLKDDPGAGTIDEGRAMSEIVYDEAPGVNSIQFASGTVFGAADKADSINLLKNAGVDVIADDIFYLSEPFFQDGVVSQAVDQAKAAGVAYFASAGNRARQSWEGTYNNLAGFENFSGGDLTQTVATVPNGGFLQITLQWDEPWGGALTDIDALLRTSAGAALPGSAPTGGADVNPATGLPREIVTWNNTSGGSVAVGLQIQRVSGTASPFMKYIARGNFGAFSVAEYPTNSNTINPDAASAAGSMSVAAVQATDPGTDTPETFSSRGPNTRLLDAAGNRLATPEVRPNPDLAASDGVSTTLSPASGLNPFFGTSAAAPSAAGIAAILRSENPSASVNEIYSQMTNPANAIDCTGSALIPDPDCGAGFILADRAVAGLDRTGPQVSAQLSPTKPNGKGGWYTKNVGVTWAPSDPESAIESTSGCDPVTVKTDGKQKLTCTAVSGGGSGTGSVTVKRDTKKPSKPKITGIKNGKPLPPKSKVKCKSKDKTSGLKSCKIKGYSNKPGKHKLKATATDKAGLKSKSSLSYVIS